MSFEELANQLISEVKRALTKDFVGEVPEEVEMLASEIDTDYGCEILPQIWTDGNYVVYIPKYNESGDIKWNKVEELPKEMQTFILNYSL